MEAEVKGIRRTYAIDRDADGEPFQMIWTGDYRTVPIIYETCPRCSGLRLVDGRCFHCWRDYRGEYREVRV